MAEGRFDPVAALRTLADHGVRFVLIGGLAGRVHGSTTVTQDLDICYAQDEDNLERLAEALVALKARIRGAPREVKFLLDADTLKRGDHFTFATTSGGLDLIGSPAGIQSYESGRSAYENLEASADEIDLEGFRIKVASLNDLIAMKRAAGRPKDKIELENLGALRDLLDETGQNP